MKAQKKRNEILEAKEMLELFIVKINESGKEACEYLLLIRKKELNCTKTETQGD